MRDHITARERLSKPRPHWKSIAPHWVLDWGTAAALVLIGVVAGWLA